MTDFDAFNEDVARASGLLKWETPDASGHWVAEMDFGTAPVIEEALTDALHRGFLGYMPRGLHRRTQEATASMVERRFGWQVDADNVSLASSVLDGLKAMLGHMLKPGSTVIVPTPAYMPFLFLPVKYGHKVVEVPSKLGEDGLWRLDFESIEAAAASADLFILCNPWNPTGRILNEDELRRVGDIAVRHDLLVFNDEIHAPLADGHVPFADLDPAFADRTVTAIAASKGFNLAGLQCAQMITAGKMIETFEPVKQWLNHPTALGALGASVAFESGDEWLADLKQYLRGNIDMVDAMLAGSPLKWSKPQGTYLSWIDASALGAENPADVFLEKARVHVNAGKTLGAGYEQFVRFNLASSRAVVERSITRMLEVAN
ncbi:MAG: aminotransferase class I/II-fold pyridoxal phosphate-dependent enzyme [Actinomycetaceae bacterium]|nr:aminotransferase class I/II-fold pyridoxal phosphate-dependent enzyme [Actinomycetaceae bacterium]